MTDPLVERILNLTRDDKHMPELADALGDVTDTQRKALAKLIGKQGDKSYTWFEARSAGEYLAVLGCVAGVRQVASRLEWMHLPRQYEPLAMEILHHRQPHWLPDLASALLVGKERSHSSVPLIRALIRDGVIEYPTIPEYPIALVRSLDMGFWRDSTTPSILELLRADRGLCEREVWDILSTEGAGRDLTTHDSWLLREYTDLGPRGKVVEAKPHRTWRHALTEAPKEGLLDRDRLLDVTLGAFLRDWPASDATWFVTLLDSLDPTDNELHARHSVLSRILATAPGGPVGWAITALGRLSKAKLLDVEEVTAAAPSALMRPDKTHPMSMLKLLKDVGTGDAGRAGLAATAAAHGLEHGRVDVQERALAVVTILVPDQRREELLQEHADGLAPSLRAEVATALVPEVAAPQATTPLAPSASSSITTGAELPATPVTAVAGPDELAEILASLIEQAADPVEVERALDGVMRFARTRPKTGASALGSRMRTVIGSLYPGPFSGEELRGDLAVLGLTWLEGTHPGKGYLGRKHGTDWTRIATGGMRSRDIMHEDWSLAALVSMRVHEVAVAAHSGGGTLLALPDRRDGSLDAATLTARIDALGALGKPLPLDTGTALLRISPDQHQQVRLPRGRRSGRQLRNQLELLRHHTPSWELVRGPSRGIYGERFDAAVTWRDQAAPAGSAENAVAAVLDRRDPLRTIGLEAEDGEYGSRFEQIVGCWPLLLPHHPDMLAAHAHARLNRALTKNRNGTEPLMAALGAGRLPLGAPAWSALALGLAAKNGAERAAATDALVELAERAGLNGHELGKALTLLLAEDAIVIGRVLPGLADVARSGVGDATLQVLAALEELLPGISTMREGAKIVDLVAQLATAIGRTVTLPPALLELAAGKPSTALAKAVRRVPGSSG